MENTIGIVEVARCIASVTATPAVSMTVGLKAAISAAAAVARC
jgi:hypothetical protein